MTNTGRFEGRASASGRRTWLTACFVVAGAATAPWATSHASPGRPLAAADDAISAPDGRRGFGTQTPVNDVLRVVRAQSEADRAFVHEIDNLASEIKVLVALTRQQYEQAKYFDLLELAEERSLDLLHERFAQLDEAPLPTLEAGGGRARALAAMIVDTRFRVRAGVLTGCELELRELERSLAVLRAATDGYVLLTQAECSNVAARADLSASLLRAVRNDLRALRQQSGPAEVDADLVERILEAAKANEGEGVRRAAVLRERDETRRLESLMSTALFSTRLRPQVAELLTWRARILREASVLATQAERALPQSDAKWPPDEELAAMTKTDRVRKAGFTALQAAQLDPLEENAVWIAAHCSEFLYGLLESRPWYDRYLALRRIRSHDHRTYADRRLTPHETEALGVVQRSILPGQPPARGL